MSQLLQEMRHWRGHGLGLGLARLLNPQLVPQTDHPSVASGLLSPPSLSRVSHSHLACEITLSSQGALQHATLSPSLPPSCPPSLHPPSVSLNSNWPNNESIIISLACSKQMGRCHSLSILIVPIHPTTSQLLHHQSLYLQGTPRPSFTCSNSSHIKMLLLGPSHSQCPWQSLSFSCLNSKPSSHKGTKGAVELSVAFSIGL